MSATGYIQVNAYTSIARMPIQNAAIAIIDSNGNTLALRLTNRSGQLDAPLAITVPDFADSQTPDPGSLPYRTVNLYAKAEDYEEIEINSIQVFPDTMTVQNLEFIPLSELPNRYNQVEIFDTPAQNL